MKKISDKELLMLFWTDSVVNSSKNHYKKSNFYKLEFSLFFHSVDFLHTGPSFPETKGTGRHVETS